VSAVYRDSLLRPVPWLASFAIDEADIDSEHRSMIDLCNELCCLTAFDSASARQRLLDEDVVAMMTHHFNTEEKVFDDIGYPETHGHRQEHNHLRWLITPLYVSAHDNGFAQSLLKVRTGLVEHIIRHDLGYKSHLLDRNGR
jgi:hemerythrin